MYEIKTEDVYKDFSKDFSNYSPKSKYYDDSNKLVVGKMKEETGAVTIKEFVKLEQKLYSFFADGRSEHKKAKGVNKNVVETISHSEFRDSFSIRNV